MIEDEWLEWYHLTPAERWQESEKLWQFYLSSGGDLNSEPDSQSPFDTLYTQREITVDGRTGVRAVRGGGIQS
ncbi:MAG: hypothetical protein M1470_00855 [Bacteroidetes bacterium]|nr:hypothetical protein [Bacteroidota bacterium]